MFFVNFERELQPCKHDIAPQAIIEKLSPFTNPDRSGFLVKDRALMIQCLHWNTPSSLFEPTPFYHAPSESVVVSWARIDNTEELTRSLGISCEAQVEFSDSELIMRSYQKWGENCIDHLIGDFAFAIYDGKEETLFCGRDHMGVRPFFYFVSDERFVCATSLAALVQPDCVPVEMDEKWICEYLCDLSMSWERTPYKGINKLPPACTLTVTTDRLESRQYFQLSSVEEKRLKDPREYVDTYREELERAVKCRLRTNYPLGSELSGGLDSSTVTAFAANFFGRPLTSLHAFAFPYFDQEPRYIEEVVKAFQLPNLHIFTDRTLHSDDKHKRSTIILGSPAEWGFNAFYEPFYKTAEDLNIRTLLSGFGGDEFVTTIFSHLVLPELVRNRRYKDLYRILPGNVLSRLLRLTKQQLKEFRASAPAYNPRVYKTYQGRLPYLLVRHELMDRYNLTERYLEQASFDAGYTNLKRFTLEKCWQPPVPTRMEICTLIAAARKIEYRWPLLDVRLVRCFLSIPSEENYFRGMGRYLHRRAVAGTVPSLVTWKPSKEMGNYINGSGEGNRHEQFSIKNLHPSLTQWIDLQKLNVQHAEMAKPVPMKENSWQIRRNLLKIVNLDHWMKQYVLPPC